LEAYFGEKLTDDAFATVVSGHGGLMDRLFGWFQNIASEKSAAVDLKRTATLVTTTITTTIAIGLCLNRRAYRDELYRETRA
jgi:hypothetical protein